MHARYIIALLTVAVLAACGSIRSEHYADRGLYYLDQNKYDEAIDAFDKAIRVDPEISEYYFQKAVALYNKNDYELAIEFYTKAIELAPTLAKAYRARGWS